MLRFFLFWIFPFVINAQNPADMGFSDLHNSSLYRIFLSGNCADFADTSFDIHLQQLEKTQSRLIFLSIGFPRFRQGKPDTTSVEAVFTFFKKFRNHCEKQYPQLRFVGNKTELESALQDKKIALAFALEGAFLLENKPAYLDSLHAVGLRMLGMAHWFHDDFISSPRDTLGGMRLRLPLGDDSVLTPQGIELLEKLIKIGVLIDVSHLRKQAFWQVVELNKNRSPLIASHANAYALCPVPRNLAPRQLRAIAESKGRIGVCLHEPILGKKPVTAPKVVAHICYLRRILGSEGLCWGSDYEGNIRPPKGLETIEALQQQIVPLLEKKGWKEAEIRAFFSENALSLFP